jgi:hypothetical protein
MNSSVSGRIYLHSGSDLFRIRPFPDSTFLDKLFPRFLRIDTNSAGYQVLLSLYPIGLYIVQCTRTMSYVLYDSLTLKLKIKFKCERVLAVPGRLLNPKMKIGICSCVDKLHGAPG